MITEKAKEITEVIYLRYGSDSGYLFGINPDHKEAVNAVIQSTLDIMVEEFNELYNQRYGKIKE